MPRVQKADTIDDTNDVIAAGDDGVDVGSWLRTLGQHSEVRVSIARSAPRFYKGIQVDGTLESTSELVDEDYIREKHGGGVFQVRVQKRDSKGKMGFAGSKTVRIAGPPDIRQFKENRGDWDEDAGGANGSDGAAVGQAMKFTEKLLTTAMADKERAEKAAQSQRGFDANMYDALTRPMSQQLEGLRDTINALQLALQEKDKQIIQMLTQKPEAGFEHKLLDKMIDGESAKIAAIREQHNSELRQVKENARHDLQLERERHEREIASIEKRHEREIDSIKEAYRDRKEADKIAADSRIDNLKNEISRLQGDVTSLKQENAELRAKKDKSLSEQAQDLLQVKESLSILGGGKDDDDGDEGKSIVERVLGRVLENPEAIGQLVGGVRGQVAPEEHEPVDAEAIARAQQAQIAAVQQERKRAELQRKRRKQVQAAAAAGQLPAPEAGIVPEGAFEPDQKPLPEGMRAPDPDEVRFAIQFMESAVQNGTKPEVFAASARSAIPANILKYIEHIGIDELLNQSNLPEGSVFRSQVGRNFARAVARVLLEGA